MTNLISRRDVLHAAIGTAAAAAITRTAPAAPQLQATAKQVIFLFMSGGPSQLDTFDVKEAADTSMVEPIRTTAAGVSVSELFPQFANQMHRAAVLRTLQTRVPDHAPGRYYTHTGYRATPGVVRPGIGSVVAKELGQTDAALPEFVQVGPVFGKVDGDETVSRYVAYGAGYLGPRFQPLVVKDPARGLEDLRPLPDDSRLRIGSACSIRRTGSSPTGTGRPSPTPNRSP